MTDRFGCVDTETLGKWDNAVIMSVGLCSVTTEQMYQPQTFDFFMDNAVSIKLDVEEQVQAGRKIESAALDFWAQQGDSAKGVLSPSPNDVSMSEFERQLREWVGSKWKLMLFERNAFDMHKIQHMLEVTMGRGSDSTPWSYTNVFGVETLLRFNSKQQDRYGAIDPKTFSHPRFLYHDAASDAALDLYRINLLLNEKPE